MRKLPWICLIQALTALALGLPMEGCSRISIGKVSAGASDGGGGGGGGTTCPGCTYKVFATSTFQDGNLGGLAGADATCTSVANAGGLTGSYIAILSTSTVNARDRITATSAIMNTNGDIVANDTTEFFGATLQNPMQYDESGAYVASDTWTGSTALGVSQGSNCSDWTSTAGSGIEGQPGELSGMRFNDFAVPCAAPSRLYCISTTVVP